MEYRKYPTSSVPGELAAEPQPLPVKPKPFATQLLTKDILSNRTLAIHAWALQQFEKFRSEGQFVPLGLEQETVIFPALMEKRSGGLGFRPRNRPPLRQLE